MEPIIALFGCGIWGKKILHTLLKKRCNIVIVDPNNNVKQYANSLGIDYFSTHDTLPDFDAAIVATPASTHYSVISNILDKNVPIFVEKPFTTNIKDAELLVEKAGPNIFLMHIWAYHPGVVMLSELVSSGQYGAAIGLRTFRTNWQSPRTDVGSDWTLFPHDLTICQEILGQIPKLKHAVTDQSNGRIVGVVACYGDNPWFVAEVSNRYEFKNRQIRLHFDSCVVVLDTGRSDYLSLYRNSNPEPEPERIPIDSHTPLDLELDSLLWYISGGPPPKCDAKSGLKIIKEVTKIKNYVNHQ